MAGSVCRSIDRERSGLGRTRPLPFADGAFDLVIAYNVLMDVADLPGAVHGIARVLAPGGRLCIAITHPVISSGSMTGTGTERTVVLDQPYFESRKIRDTESRDGMEMTFVGWQHPLSGYTRALEDAGLLIESLREPMARRYDGSIAPIPFHLWFRVLKLA